MDSSKGADGIVATKNIKTLSDLKGKKVAFEVGSSSHLLLSYFLEQKGFTTNDLTIVNLSAPDAGAAFVTGKVDAAVTWEPWLSKGTERPGGHILIDSKDLPIFPDFYILRAQIVEKHPEAIRAMLRALFTARKFALEYPAEAQKIIAKNLSISDANAAAEINTLEWLDYAQNMKYFNGSPSEARKLLQETADLWLRLKLIKHKIEVHKIVDPTLLKIFTHDKKKIFSATLFFSFRTRTAYPAAYMGSPFVWEFCRTLFFANAYGCFFYHHPFTKIWCSTMGYWNQLFSNFS